MEAIILCGGRGTRLKDTIGDIPKCLAPIHGRPFLDYLLHSLSSRGITRFILATGYQKHLVRQAYENSKYNIVWSEEETPLGTGGAVKQALRYAIEPNIFIINGDTLFDIDLKEMLAFHIRNKYTITAAGSISAAVFGEVTGSMSVAFPKFFTFGGTTIIVREMEARLTYEATFEDAFSDYYLGLYGSDKAFIDIGTPESYERIKHLKIDCA